MVKKSEKFSEILNYLVKTVENKNKNYDKNSYTSNLLKKGIDRISQKVGEEAIEVVIAANKKSKKNIIYESADLLFHLIILWKKKEISLFEVAQELERRKNEK